MLLPPHLCSLQESWVGVSVYCTILVLPATQVAACFPIAQHGLVLFTSLQWISSLCSVKPSLWQPPLAPPTTQG